MGPRTFRLLSWAFALLVGLAVAAPYTMAQGVDRSLRVVVNKENKLASLSTDDLNRIFLGKKTLWDSGVRIVPAMPEEESPAGETFLSGTLKKSVSQFFRNSSQLIDFVARNPGAIAVVETGGVEDRVRVIEISD